MENIKFRAYSKQNKGMYFIGYTLKDISEMDSANTDWDDLIVTRFTGLKDSQNKEIYEGDFLTVDWIDQRYSPHIIGPVEWDEDNACWDIGEGGSPKRDAKSHMEIIGNIYSNPELLN